MAHEGEEGGVDERGSSPRVYGQAALNMSPAKCGYRRIWNPAPQVLQGTDGSHALREARVRTAMVVALCLPLSLALPGAPSSRFRTCAMTVSVEDASGRAPCSATAGSPKGALSVSPNG